MEHPGFQPLTAADRHSPGRKYTWVDFIALPDDDRRELIDGALVETEVPTELHEHIVVALSSFLYVWARARRAGTVLASGYKIRVSDQRGVMPDIQFFRKGSSASRTPQGVTQGAPDLAVEIISASSGRYDRVTKLNWYAQLGVREYWIVDPEARTLEQLVLRDGHYLVANALSDSDVFQPESFAGLEIPLAELWTIPGSEESR